LEEEDGFLESRETKEGCIAVCLGEVIAIGYGERYWHLRCFEGETDY